MSRGRLIVIEGLDGSGKATQAELLTKSLKKADKPVTKISFPDYESEASALVRMYLSGEIGGINDVNVYAASSFYAADRYVSFVKHWKEPYETGYTIVADRYTTSNITHQMPKLPRGEWERYLNWIEDFEYVKMALPRPDIVLYLDMLPETSRGLLKKRYLGDFGKEDIHERNFKYLVECRSAALYTAEKLNWKIIRCCDGTGPLPVEEITDAIEKMIGDTDIHAGLQGDNAFGQAMDETAVSSGQFKF